MKIVEIVKKDILNSIKELEPVYYPALLEGYLRGGAELKLSKNGFQIEVSSDVASYIEAIVNLLVRLGATEQKISVHNRQNIGSHLYYTAELSVQDSSTILQKCGISDGNYTIFDNISSFVKANNQAAKNYLRGLFLATGRLSIPDKGSGKRQGYHLEMMLSSERSCDETIELLNAIDICHHASKVTRGYNVSVYVKSMDDIADFVVAMGSTEAFLQLQEVIMERGARNHSNRSNNCFSANIDKMANASSQMILDIELIDKKIGLASLPKTLEQVAIARRDYPDVSLAELLAYIDNPPTKSGLQHRLKKLKEIAQEIRDKETRA